MEIADLFVLNKADREGADQAANALKTILALRITHAEGEWIPDVVKTVGTTGAGLDELVAGIEKHKEHMLALGALEKRRTARERERVEEIVEDLLRHNFWSPDRRAALNEALPQLLSHERSPLEVAEALVEGLIVKE
jgi:LAO/AO transport system kinase